MSRRATRRRGGADAIYDEFFAICRRLLVDGGRLVTTAIHFRKAGQFDPHEILRGPAAHRRGSDDYQMALLVRTFGGWYPEPGQLARCAAPYFELVAGEDGTEDYRRTSEHWLHRLRFRGVQSTRLGGSCAQMVATPAGNMGNAPQPPLGSDVVLAVPRAGADAALAADVAGEVTSTELAAI